MSTSWSGERRAFPTSMRARILKRHPICAACGAAPSVIADHIIPVAEGGRDVMANGQGMCVPCHDVKTHEERRRGIARNSRRRPPETHPGLLW